MIAERRIPLAPGGTPEEFEDRRVGEFRRPAHAAVHRVHVRRQLGGDLVEVGEGQSLRLARGGAGEMAEHGLRVLGDAAGIRPVGLRRAAQDGGEGRLAVAGKLGKVGAAPEWLAARRKEHGERPAAALAECLQGAHVDVVDVRSLLAVDLDRNEQRVHHLGCFRVFEALVRHDVAPVTGGVADRQKNGLVLALRLGQGRRGPRPPVHGIVGMLQQVGAGGIF